MNHLRNKPGGLARVRLPRDDGDGSYDMQGCYVTTVHRVRQDVRLEQARIKATTREGAKEKR